jgi:hypothetical protein
MYHPPILNGECKIVDSSSQYKRMYAVFTELAWANEHHENFPSWVFMLSILGLTLARTQSQWSMCGGEWSAHSINLYSYTLEGA